MVLAKDDACGGGLKVIDIPEGVKPKVPATWPGVPLLIDSPDYPTTLEGDAVAIERIRVSWTMHESLGVNMAGLEVALNLLDRWQDERRQTRRLLSELRERLRQ